MSRFSKIFRVSRILYGNNTNSVHCCRLANISTSVTHFIQKQEENDVSLTNFPSKKKYSFKKIGFVGLGNMGAPMAANIMRGGGGGREMMVTDRNPEILKVFEAKGAKIFGSCAEVSENADVVVTMLPSTPQVLDVYLGKEGLLKNKNNLNPKLFIDCSTIDPSTSRKISNSVSLCKISKDSKDSNFSSEAKSLNNLNFFDNLTSPKMIDAPVSGGVQGAKEGTLTFMVGGTPQAVEEGEEILSFMGSQIVHCGPSGAGTAAKVCNNLALAIQMAGISEALNLGQKLGLDPKILSLIFNSSSARSWSSEVYNPVPGVLENVPSSRNYSGGFSNFLMLKDIKLALDSAREEGVEAKIFLASTVYNLYSKMCEENFEKDDFSSIFRHIYGGIGVDVNSKKL